MIIPNADRTFWITELSTPHKYLSADLRNVASQLADDLIEQHPPSEDTRELLETLGKPVQGLVLGVIDYIFRFPGHDKDQMGADIKILEFDSDWSNIVADVLRADNTGTKRDFSSDEEDNELINKLVPYITKIYRDIFSIFFLSASKLVRKIEYDARSLEPVDLMHYQLVVERMEEVVKKSFDHSATSPVLGVYGRDASYDFTYVERLKLRWKALELSMRKKMFQAFENNNMGSAWFYYVPLFLAVSSILNLVAVTPDPSAVKLARRTMKD